MIRTIFRVLRALPEVEIRRRLAGPAQTLAILRSASNRPNREPSERAKVQRVIRLIDSMFPDGGNCYRRALLEISLDADAARETLFFGLKAHGGPRSGHAWLASWPEAAASASRYDAIVEM